MAMVRCNFFSDVLGFATSMTVLLPQRTQEQIGAESVVRSGPPPVLYLLHGLSDDDTAWLRYTSIDRYAAELGLAVVMPQVHRSWYTDLPGDGGRYWTFLSEELPRVVADFFVVSDRREDTHVAGLSMGGFGAMKWALNHPDRFATAASLSGVVDPEDLAVRRLEPERYDWVLGGRTFAETHGDIPALLDALDPASAPRLWLCCGDEETALLPSNHAFVDRARAHGLDVTADFGPGDHVWSYWDAALTRYLPWLASPTR